MTEIKFDKLSRGGRRELSRVVRTETALRRSGQEPRMLADALAAEWECGECPNKGEECHECPGYVTSQRVITYLWEIAAC